MSVLFLINTPAQAMNAAIIAMTIHENDKCDAYYTDNVSAEVESFAEQNVFTSVYKIKLVKDIFQRNSKISRALVRIKNALDFDNIVNSLPSNPMIYDRVYVSGISLRIFEIYYAIKKINSDVSFSLYEEGICEYYELGMKKSYPKIWFSKLFFGQYYLNNCDSVYVHNPKFVQNIWRNIKVKEIPSYSSRGKIIKVLNHAFGYKSLQMESIHNKFIVIEQSFSSLKYEKKQKMLIDLLVKCVGKDKVIVKLHPRSSEDKYKGLNVIHTKIPLEIIGINEDIFDNIYISIVSSAVANFRLFLDKQPKVIMLYELMEDPINKNVEKLFGHLRSDYKEGLFLTPKSIGEFIHKVGLLNV